MSAAAWRRDQWASATASPLAERLGPREPAGRARTWSGHHGSGATRRVPNGRSCTTGSVPFFEVADRIASFRWDDAEPRPCSCN